jgi:hypothetical protein
MLALVHQPRILGTERSGPKKIWNAQWKDLHS